MKNQNIELEENKIHGSPMLPLFIYLDMHINKGGNIYCHWHKEVEFIYVEKGEIDFNIDMKKIKVKEGECLLINAGSLHSGDVVGEKESTHHAIVFNLNFLSSGIYDYCQSKYIDPLINGKMLFPSLISISTDWGKDAIFEIKSMIKIYRNKATGWELSIKSSLLKVISILAADNGFEFKKDMKVNIKDYKIEVIKKIIQYIRENYKNKIYVDSLSKVANMNTQYFCRFFKLHTGKTPVDYINQYRVEKASEILKNDDRKIIDVCYEVGFDNISYFIKKFKEYKNCTPAKFRKLYKFE